MKWSAYLASMKREWVGAVVKFEGMLYVVFDVDSNGCLLIDKVAQFTSTTAVTVGMVQKLAGGEGYVNG